MTWGGPNFIVVIVAVCTAGWIITNVIRAQHGYDTGLRIKALRRTGKEVTTQ